MRPLPALPQVADAIMTNIKMTQVRIVPRRIDSTVSFSAMAP